MTGCITPSYIEGTVGSEEMKVQHQHSAIEETPWITPRKSRGVVTEPRLDDIRDGGNGVVLQVNSPKFRQIADDKCVAVQVQNSRCVGEKVV